MSFKYFSLLIFGIVMVSCKENHPTPFSFVPDESSMVRDTVQIRTIQEQIEFLNKMVHHKPKTFLTDSTYHGTPHSIEYYDLPDAGLTRIFYSDRTEANENPIQFYYDRDKKQLIEVHYRFWNKVAPYFAEEIFMYFRDGNLFYAEDRRMELTGDEAPVMLRTMPLEMTQKSKPALYDLIRPMWEVSFKAVEHDRDTRAQPK